jgi:hypothetical protein
MDLQEMKARLAQKKLSRYPVNGMMVADEGIELDIAALEFMIMHLDYVLTDNFLVRNTAVNRKSGYDFPGRIAAAYMTFPDCDHPRMLRYVVQMNGYGLQHIFTPETLIVCTAEFPERCASYGKRCECRQKRAKPLP